MSCGKCGKGLCPLSFGLAVGMTAFFAVFLWSLWVLQYGVPPMMAAEHMVVPATLTAGVILALWCLLKGFLFGFFVALFYDVILKCKSCCCKKTGANGGCGSVSCPNCGSGNSPKP